jgi:hypothetical protein
LWRSFCAPILWSLIIFIADIARSIQGPRFAVMHWPRTWHEILSTALLFAVIAGLVVYVLQLAIGRPLSPFEFGAKVVICDTCYRVKRRDSDEKCECGGMFEDFENWTWIEDGGSRGQT